MHHINTAVVKSFLIQLPKTEFIIYARYFRKKAFTSEAGSNQRYYFLNLYKWCRDIYGVLF